MKFEIKKFLLILCIVFNDSLCQIIFHLCWTPLLPKTLLFSSHCFCIQILAMLIVILSFCLTYWHVIYENEMVKTFFKNHWTTTKVSKHQFLFIHVVYHNVDVITYIYINKYICKTQVMLVNIIFDKPLMEKNKVIAKSKGFQEKP
jgi:hypothetical protein